MGGCSPKLKKGFRSCSGVGRFPAAEVSIAATGRAVRRRFEVFFFVENGFEVLTA